jgi:hypothetical protein
LAEDFENVTSHDEHRASVIVRCLGGFLLLADERCAVNREEFWGNGFKPSERGKRLAAFVRNHEVFQWDPILDGTFRIDFLAYDERNIEDTVDQFAARFVLELPTGKLTVRSSETTVPALMLNPGTYTGTLFWDYGAESEHSTIDSIDEYPDNEHPDGRIILRAVAPPDPIR